MADIVDIYMECGDFRESVRKSGLPVHIAHLKLLKSGCLKTQDKIAFGSRGARLGGMAEELFQRLVPDAVDANKYFVKNNPVYDFMFGNLTIDVKYSSVRVDKRYDNEYWAVNCNGNQDFLCIFLEKERGLELDDPYVLLIPMQFISSESKTLHISLAGEIFKNFCIEKEELQPIFREYSLLREKGLY